ncbi:MAG: RNA pseudouridine synthase [Deltaproteobacteria bacterium]|nr:RNA pseudouridine synthase [Deltaproteobacteria bacterium]
MILDETSDLRFIAKPPGLPVFPPHGDPSGDCVLRRYLATVGALPAFPAGFEGGIAHRLDNLTSGFLVVAKTPEALARVRAAWRQLRKLYRFRSAGQLDGPVTVEAPIAHHPRRADRVVVRHGGRQSHRGRWLPAWTRIVPLGGDWFEAEIRTGVMHQVRAHAAFAGVPLRGDGLYGGGEGIPTLVHVAITGPGCSFRLPDPPGPR